MLLQGLRASAAVAGFGEHRELRPMLGEHLAQLDKAALVPGKDGGGRVIVRAQGGVGSLRSGQLEREPAVGVGRAEVDARRGRARRVGARAPSR